MGSPHLSMKGDMLACLLLPVLVTCGPHTHQGVHSNHGREQAVFEVVEQQGDWETRRYPSATWVCTNMTVDTAGDPLAGLEHMDIFQIRDSNRYKTRVPSSLMFHRLYDYIGANNEGGVRIALTRGEFTKHTIQKTDKQGNIELQERCLYLEKKIQAGGTQSVPAPLDPEVYVRNMKELSVLVRKYPGWIFTAASWEHSHHRFLDEVDEVGVAGKEKVSHTVFYTRRSGWHWIPEQDRYHEIWIPVA